VIRAAILVLALAACGGGRVTAPAPATPIVAEADPPARPAAQVCGELVADLDRYHACVPDDRKRLIRAWHERATLDFAALDHPTVTDADRAETARACAKAGGAIRAALAACPARIVD